MIKDCFYASGIIMIGLCVMCECLNWTFFFVGSFIDSLKIEEHANKIAKDLSGGTKRKVRHFEFVDSYRFLHVDSTIAVMQWTASHCGCDAKHIEAWTYCWCFAVFECIV